MRVLPIIVIGTSLSTSFAQYRCSNEDQDTCCEMTLDGFRGARDFCMDHGCSQNICSGKPVSGGLSTWGGGAPQPNSWGSGWGSDGHPTFSPTLSPTLSPEWSAPAYDNDRSYGYGGGGYGSSSSSYGGGYSSGSSSNKYSSPSSTTYYSAPTPPYYPPQTTSYQQRTPPAYPRPTPPAYQKLPPPPPAPYYPPAPPAAPQYVESCCTTNQDTCPEKFPMEKNTHLGGQVRICCYQRLVDHGYKSSSSSYGGGSGYGAPPHQYGGGGYKTPMNGYGGGAPEHGSYGSSYGSGGYQSPAHGSYGSSYGSGGGGYQSSASESYGSGGGYGAQYYGGGGYQAQTPRYGGYGGYGGRKLQYNFQHGSSNGNAYGRTSSRTYNMSPYFGLYGSSNSNEDFHRESSSSYYQGSYGGYKTSTIDQGHQIGLPPQCPNVIPLSSSPTASPTASPTTASPTLPDCEDRARNVIGVYSQPNLNGLTGVGDCSAESDNLLSIVAFLRETDAVFANFERSDSIQSFDDPLLQTKLGELTFFLMPDIEGTSLTGWGAESQTIMRNYVNGGGAVLVTGVPSAGGVDFLNDIFGWDLSAVGCTSVSSAKNTANTADTIFSDGPDTLDCPSATGAINCNSVDCTVMYGVESAAGVAVINQGEGLVIFLGFDFFDSGYEVDGFHTNCNQREDDWVVSIFRNSLQLAAGCA